MANIALSWISSTAARIVLPVMRFDGVLKISDFFRQYSALLIVSAMLAVFNSVYVIAAIPPSSLAQLIASYMLPVCFVA